MVQRPKQVKLDYFRCVDDATIGSGCKHFQFSREFSSARDKRTTIATETIQCKYALYDGFVIGKENSDHLVILIPQSAIRFLKFMGWG
jgi:hypothetical protein